MSLDLAILPQHLPNFSNNNSFETIRFPQNSSLLNDIRQLSDTVGYKEYVPVFHCGNVHNTDSYEEITNDKYGQPLRFVFVEDFKHCFRNIKLSQCDYRIRSIFAYINELHDNLKLWLYWS